MEKMSTAYEALDEKPEGKRQHTITSRDK